MEEKIGVFMHYITKYKIHIDWRVIKLEWIELTFAYWEIDGIEIEIDGLIF